MEPFEDFEDDFHDESFVPSAKVYRVGTNNKDSDQGIASEKKSTFKQRMEKKRMAELEIMGNDDGSGVMVKIEEAKGLANASKFEKPDVPVSSFFCFYNRFSTLDFQLPSIGLLNHSGVKMHRSHFIFITLNQMLF